MRQLLCDEPSASRSDRTSKVSHEILAATTNDSLTDGTHARSPFQNPVRYSRMRDGISALFRIFSHRWRPRRSPVASTSMRVLASSPGRLVAPALREAEQSPLRWDSLLVHMRRCFRPFDQSGRRRLGFQSTPALLKWSSA